MLLIPIFLKASSKDCLLDRTSHHGDDEPEEMGEPSESAQPRSSMNTNKDARADGLIPTPPGLIDFVLKMILHDVSFLVDEKWEAPN